MKPEADNHGFQPTEEELKMQTGTAKPDLLPLPSPDGGPTWEEIAARKRQALLDSMPPEWRIPAELMPSASRLDVAGWPAESGWFTSAELAITESTASELLGRLASGQLTSVEVTRAFCKRAAAAHQLINCLSETCFDRALAMAAARDEHLARTGRPMGPLHGIPISLKDNFNLRGLDATVGFVSLVGRPSGQDATLAKMLEAAGAVFYVKTNVPTAMMIAESVNNTLGRTVNPRNRALTSGGSSGGESALISFRGSPWGVGTDIGGSLRIPAALTGLFTLRPSFGRFPTLGCASGMAGQEAVPSVNGPLTSTLEDLELYCRAVVAGQPWLEDPRCLPLPWRDDESAALPDKLRIAVLWHDGIVRPTAPIARALRTTTDRLRAAGHEVTDWDPQADHIEGNALLGRMFTADGGQSIRRLVEAGGGEPWRPEMTLYETAAEMGTYDMWQLHLARVAFAKRYLDRWNEARIDGILCPTAAFAGVRNGEFVHVAYTGVFNVLDYACVSFPTGLTVDEKVDLPLGDDYTALGETCATVHQRYDPSIIHGMPINLQLVARRLEEEKVVEMTRRVLDVLS